MKKSEALAVIPPPQVVSRGRRILVVGADAGAEHNAPALADSANEITEVVYGDALHANARRVAERATTSGVPARGIALTTRDIEAFEPKVDLVIGHLDRAAAHREAMRASLARSTPYLGYQFIQAPSMLAQGAMLAIAPDDHAAIADADLLWSTIAPITARRGSAAIFRDGAPEQSMREGAVRELFRDHTRSAVKKLLAGLPLDLDPLQMTDGRDVYPLIVLASDRWSTNDEIEQRVVHERRDVILEPGTRILVAECLAGDPPEIRFHDARFGRRGRRLVTHSSRTLTQASFDAPPPLPPREGARSTTPRTRTRQRTDELTSNETGDLASALVTLALLAVLLGAASRTAPVNTTD